MLRRHITDSTVNPFAVIPAFDIFKDCPPGFLEILVSMEINFLLLQHRMEGFYARIVIRISLSAERMQDTPFSQIAFKCQAGVLAPKVAVENDARCVFYIQAR